MQPSIAGWLLLIWSAAYCAAGEAITDPQSSELSRIRKSTPESSTLLRFTTIRTDRNLRGLFPLDREDTPGERVSDPVSSPLSMVGTGGQVAYIAEVMFGDRGPFKMVVDTGSSDTWLVAEKFRCLDAESKVVQNAQCKLGPGYRPSSTFRALPNLHFSIQYGDGEKLQGIVGNETVKIGSLAIPDQRINIVDNASWNGDSQTSGLLGLGFPANTANFHGITASDISKPAIYDPVFATAVKSGLIPSGSFAIALQRDAAAGFISFGGLPPVKTFGPTTTVRFAPPKSASVGQTEYTIPLTGFKFSGSETTKPGSLEGLIDSGTAILLVPAAVARAYNALWDPATQEAPPFSVLIDDVEFPIDPSDLRIKGSKGYSSAVMASKRTILGDTFMRNVVSVFEVSAGQMKFASTNPKSGPERAMTL